jgi:hypothetical protein
MARTSDPHAATLKAWETRAHNAGSGGVVQSSGDFADPKVVPSAHALAGGMPQPLLSSVTPYKLPKNRKEREARVGVFMGEFHPPKGSPDPVGNLFRVGKGEDGKSRYRVLVVNDGVVSAESRLLGGNELAKAGGYGVTAAQSIDIYRLKT